MKADLRRGAAKALFANNKRAAKSAKKILAGQVMGGPFHSLGPNVRCRPRATAVGPMALLTALAARLALGRRCLYPRAMALRFVLLTVLLGSAVGATGCRWLASFPASATFEVSASPDLARLGDGGSPAEKGIDGAKVSSDAQPSDTQPSDTQRPDGATGPVQALHIAAGEGFSCAISADGFVSCWGNNEYGHLGNDRAFVDTPRPGPVLYRDPSNTGVPTPLKASQVVAGPTHACALEQGKVYCWGSNWASQGGVPWDAPSNDWMLPTARPVDWGPLAANPPQIVSLALGWEHSCALDAKGGVWCWGWAEQGQLGRPAPFGGWAQDGEPAGLITTTAPGTIAPPMSQLACGSYHCCALAKPLLGATLQAVFCWGSNWGGQAAVTPGAPLIVPSPALVALPPGFSATAIVAGGDLSCALGEAGGASMVRCWGDFSRGQAGAQAPIWGQAAQWELTKGIPGGAPLKQLTLGTANACAVTNRDELYCWGANHYGELGYQAVEPFIGDQAQAQSVPVRVNVNTAQAFLVSEVACGADHCCAIEKGTGAPFCWGRNLSGALSDGDGRKEDRADAPVSGPPLPPAANAPLTMGANNGCWRRLDDRGTPSQLVCWGAGDRGELGLSKRAAQPAPVSIAIMANDGSTQRDLGWPRLLGLGEGKSCGYFANMGLFCWGSGDASPMEAPAEPHLATAVQGSDALASIDALAVGTGHACYLRDGALKCWGRNYHGMLGSGTQTDSASPIAPAWQNLGPAPPTITGIAASRCSTCAHSANAIYCWGCNHGGELGVQPMGGALLTPTGLALGSLGIRKVQKIALSPTHGCALATPQVGGAEGPAAMLCWGQNWWGELGRDTSSQLAPYGPNWVAGLQEAGASIYGNPGTVKDIALGVNFSCALKEFTRSNTTTAAVYCWGRQQAFRLGVSGADPLVPKEVPGLPAQLSAIFAGHHHVCAVAADGLRCWGESSLGQLGSGSIPPRNLVKVPLSR